MDFTGIIHIKQQENRRTAIVISNADFHVKNNPKGYRIYSTNLQSSCLVVYAIMSCKEFLSSLQLVAATSFLP